jgi:acyl-coenzyme A thioesterase PaaI-like protein
MYVVLLSAIGPAGLAVTTNLTINFLRKGAPGNDVLAAPKLLKLGKRLAMGEIVRFSVGHFNRSDCACDCHLFHSRHRWFLMVI